jgi:hypothetical protein
MSLDGAKYDEFPIYLRDLINRTDCWDISEVSRMVDTLIKNNLAIKGDNNEKTALEKDS